MMAADNEPRTGPPQKKSENGRTSVGRGQPVQSPASDRLPNARAHSVIDCDIHNELSSIDLLIPYLADYWQDYIRSAGYPGPAAGDYPRGAPISARPGSIPPGGGAAGASLELVRRQALAPFNTEIGILNCAFRVQSVKQEDLAVDLATAVNRWQIDEWLAPEPASARVACRPQPDTGPRGPGDRTFRRTPADCPGSSARPLLHPLRQSILRSPIRRRRRT